MKKITAILICAVLAALTTATVSAAVLSPGLEVIAEEYSMTVSALTGEAVSFSAEQLCSAMGREDISKIKLTSLPGKDEGTLTFGDVEATEGQVIKRDSIEKLCFTPCEDTEKASFDFSVDGSYTVTCNVLYTDKKNSAPTVFDAGETRTFTDTAASGEMRGVDPDGDKLYFEVVDYPVGGKLTFDSSTGEFTYKAGSRVMSDSFTYRVKDSMGEYSETVSHSILITKNETETTFADMDGSGANTAATIMTDKGYMSAEEKDGELCFEPDSTVSRVDFLVTAMNVLGAKKVPTIENTGFADDGDIGVENKGYVYSAAKLGIISDVDSSPSFRPTDSITKAEASVILNNIIGYKAKTECSFEGVPQWAGEAVSAMYELGVYDLEEGQAQCNAALTKAEAADMLYKVTCLVYE